MRNLWLASTVSLGLALTSSAALAQQPGASQQQDRVGAILGALFGDRLGVTTSIEAQWAAGRFPLATQRAQFESRLEADVRAGALTRQTADRLRADYADLVQLEARYGADRRFTTQERTELADRYGALTQALAEGGTTPSGGAARAEVAEGRAAFEARVDAAVAARRLSRTEATRLRSDYAALIQVEAGYLRSGATLTTAQRADLDARLDALDQRVGDTQFGGGATPATPAARLDAIARALPASGLSAAAQAQLRVEHEDLRRLDAALSRFQAGADDRAYLDRRIVDLETRARVRR